MKMILCTSIFFLSITNQAMALANWANCGGGPQTEAIQDVFWKSDINGSNGPDYELKSGQTFNNAGALCRDGQVLKAKDWTMELKKINPAKAVSSFKVIQTAEEFQKFLSDNAVEVNDFNRLNEAVTAYLDSKPMNYESASSMLGKVSHPAIIVGASKKEAIILLASSNGKTQFATLMQIKFK